jgi:hypothetical protein
MKCDFCSKDSNDVILIVGKRNHICECCIGQVVDVILKRKATNIVDVGKKYTVCDICESEESIFYFNKNQLHICLKCVGTSLETLAMRNLEKHLEGSPYREGKSEIKKGANFEF